MAGRIVPLMYAQPSGPDRLAEDIGLLRDRVDADRAAGRPQDAILEAFVFALCSYLPLVPDGGTEYPEPIYGKGVPWEVPTAIPDGMTPEDLTHTIMMAYDHVNRAYQHGGYDDDIWTLAYNLKAYAFCFSGGRSG